MFRKFLPLLVHRMMQIVCQFKSKQNKNNLKNDRYLVKFLFLNLFTL